MHIHVCIILSFSKSSFFFKKSYSWLCILKGYIQLKGQMTPVMGILIWFLYKFHFKRITEVWHSQTTSWHCVHCSLWCTVTLLFSPHRTCISHQMMKKKECFFCKTIVTAVDDLQGHQILTNSTAGTWSASDQSGRRKISQVETT